jgi:DNA end-binding protein Ku
MAFAVAFPGAKKTALLLVKAKIEGRPLPKKTAPAPTKTTDLLQAFRESAGIGSGGKPKRAATKADGAPKAKRRTARSKRAA